MSNVQCGPENDADSSRRLQLISVLNALANDSRLAIIEMLSDNALRDETGASISAVAAAVGVSRFSASRHLRILVAAGAASVDRQGLTLIHRVESAGLELVEDWLLARALVLDD